MAWTNPTAVITQLRTQLEACASWSTAGGATAKIHYPKGTAADGFPCAVLAEESQSHTKFAYGMAAVKGGQLSINLADTTSTGEVETLARAIANEICTDLGLVNLSVEDITPAEEPHAAEEAEGSNMIYECEIILSYGLET